MDKSTIITGFILVLAAASSSAESGMEYLQFNKSDCSLYRYGTKFNEKVFDGESSHSNSCNVVVDKDKLFSRYKYCHLAGVGFKKRDDKSNHIRNESWCEIIPWDEKHEKYVFSIGGNPLCYFVCITADG